MTASLRERLPTVGDRRVAVRVTADALRQLRGGSPWLYDGSITSANREAAAGDLAVVFDARRRFAAIGLWDPTSPIRVRVLQVGDPKPIDFEFWRTRFADALERRRVLADDPGTDAYRCVHGENDGLPGLVVDRYAGTVVAKLYTPAWFPHLADVTDALQEALAPERIVVRFGRSVAAGDTFGLSDGEVVVGRPLDGAVRFVERGLRLEADVVHGQKTGHFLDQRDNRALVRGMAEGREVLDVFASTGGFSVAAAAGGARRVHLVDRSAPALGTARRNLDHNRHLAEVRRCAVRTTVGDAFEALTDLGERRERFDLVVVDPPSFASSRRAVPGALAAYGRLTRLALGAVRAGGSLVMASCSSRVSSDEFAQEVHIAAAAAGADVVEVRRTGHAVDHPIGFEHGAYLKALFLLVRSS